MNDILPPPMQVEPVMLAIHGWLKHVDLSTVIEYWWMAQAELATERERHAARLADPNDLYGCIVQEATP